MSPKFSNNIDVFLKLSVHVVLSPRRPYITTSVILVSIFFVNAYARLKFSSHVYVEVYTRFLRALASPLG